MFARLAVLALVACAFAHDVLFEDFKRTFGRNYVQGTEAVRRACFQRNLERISLLNAQDTASYVVNKFADLCPEEFAEMYLSTKVANLSIPETKANIVAPTSFDWRTQGAVNAIKDQQQCGSCWAFSAVAAMEGAWKLGKGQLVSLSEEELVQCATTAGQGCQGGWMDKAITWVINHKGINSEAAYPYTSGNGITGNCDSAKAAVSVASFKTLIKSTSNEDDIAAFLVQNGVLSIAVDASNWSAYGGGIKTNCGGRSLNHGVAIVGYGESGATKYWIVRNSWGVGWGESGYIRLQRGVNCDGMTYMIVTATV